MPTNPAYSYPTTKAMGVNDSKIVSAQCPQCGTAVSRRTHYCSKCGASLTVCSKCRSINLSFGRFCHMCRQLLMVAPAPNEIGKIVTWETRDFDVLDQAVLAIIKLRGGLISLLETGAALGVATEEITESIERLELAHQIERAESGPKVSEFFVENVRHTDTSARGHNE